MSGRVRKLERERESGRVRTLERESGRVRKLDSEWSC